ncbi:MULTISPECIES: AIR synthase-related protein [Metallosphaera]|uniref:AIR synthase related protein domain protein n=3 Tax=Metallosphaera TaxID=41980 RepID=A4YIN6_METS5|nr:MULTISPECIES: AIR synthase-related protein [Metallosphaera]ABP96288.1 AIR synthase related protein domain protein [Metallosphaera sedula DSM 5348]AIM28271.1 AIR synthase related protein domain protein [Metallosphaera sedula]AKV75076.1 AIR synthase [Metallosphaera sedula]AKV77315.1 AIR synthase [Metallosphaera sedula]AKV79565.1 AIR synthase [Metallosphaera sedula]
MDLEGYARRLWNHLDESQMREELLRWLEFYKGKRELNQDFVDAVIREVKNSENFKEFSFTRVGLTAGDSGLGSRGLGDNLIHLKLFELSKRNLETFDDAGIVQDIVVSVDGIHSRLSYFPFLAGFHATKATLRDIMVKGAIPLGILVDIHLSDDSDVSMLFDFEAGVSTVADALNVPILAGSTLRIGGDMVLGERISGGVASVGRLQGEPFTRKRISEGQHIVMTEGHGGGTISSMAIFHGIEGVVEETLRVKDLEACLAVRRVRNLVSSMTDVTNGGIRGDALEISEVTNVSLVIDEDEFLSLINPRIRKAMNELGIDPFGLSLDSILIFTNNPDEVIRTLRDNHVQAKTIGEVTRRRGYPIVTRDGREMRPAFRESPYTPIKAVIGNYSPMDLDEIKKRLERAYLNSLSKKEKVLKNLKTGSL